jgi:peptide chain release factor subunit 1
MAEKVEDDDSHVQMWKVKQLIRKLSAARGNGTSMISLIIPPRDQVSRVQKMLGDEFGTASNIKSRVTRQSVLSAITSTQQKLKNYSRVPPNGLVVYCGMITTGARVSTNCGVTTATCCRAFRRNHIRTPCCCHSLCRL